VSSHGVMMSEGYHIILLAHHTPNTACLVTGYAPDNLREVDGPHTLATMPLLH
jgi:hypothetical protein